MTDVYHYQTTDGWTYSNRAGAPEWANHKPVIPVPAELVTDDLLDDLLTAANKAPGAPRWAALRALRDALIAGRPRPQPAESWCLLDVDGDWWVSDDGERFTTGARSAFLGPLTLDHIARDYGIDSGEPDLEPTEPGWYAYSGGRQTMIFHLRQSGQWSAHYHNGSADDCTWDYVKQALDVWDLVPLQPERVTP